MRVGLQPRLIRQRSPQVCVVWAVKIICDAPWLQDRKWLFASRHTLQADKSCSKLQPSMSDVRLTKQAVARCLLCCLSGVGQAPAWHRLGKPDGRPLLATREFSLTSLSQARDFYDRSSNIRPYVHLGVVLLWHSFLSSGNLWLWCLLDLVHFALAPA